MSNNIRYLLLLLPLLSSVHLQFSNALTIPKIKVEKVTTERCLTDQVKQEVMDIAVFRNKLVSAEMKIANQMEKRDTYDRTKSLLTGLSIGVVTGVGVGAATYMTTGDMQNSFENVMYVSSGIGLPLAISFGTGGKVFVMTDEQCRRGLLQDYVSGVWQDGDVAFVGKVRDYMNVNNGKYKPSNGVLASVDCQLRNSSSGKGSTTVYGTLPSHIHIKNMSVDEDLRGNGIASKVSRYMQHAFQLVFIFLV